MVWLSGGCLDNSKNTNAESAQGVTGVEVSYAYDALGRLIQTSSSDGSGVEYSYDAVGNITAIHRLDTTSLSVLDFVPRTGTWGTGVTVYGSGFDPTAAANTVTFNGVAATAIAATATSLTVHVPSGATTGPIAISNGHGSATSATNFVVLGTSPTPTITGFSPKVATLGTVVTVTGTNFQLDPEADNVEIAGRVADVVHDASSPTATQLKLIVPSSTSSGHISVTTPYGTAASADELVSVPSTINPALVEVTGRVTINGPALPVSITAAGNKAAILFDAQAGQVLHVVPSGGTFTGATTLAIYDPNGDLARTVAVGNAYITDISGALTLTGAYTAILSPSSTGSITIGLVADVTGVLAMNGSTPVTLASGQNGSFTFSAQANTGYGLALPGLVFSPSGGSMNVRVTKADGTVVTTCSFTASGSCDFDPTSFATTGTYTVVFDPVNAAAATFNAVLSGDITGTTDLDQTTAVTFARAGQNARYTFDNQTAGQRINIVFNGSTIDDGNTMTSSSTQVIIVGPTGTILSSSAFNSIQLGTTIDLALAATGTHTVIIKPSGLDLGTVNMAVRTEAAGAMTLEGDTSCSLSAGRNARYTFTAQANTGYGLAVSGLGFTPASGVPSPLVNVTLRKSDGTALVTCSFTVGSSCNFDPSNFASTGTYLVDFDPNSVYATAFTATLSTDVMGVVSGTGVGVSIARAGQNARYTFTGSSGQVLDIEPSNDFITGDPNGNNGTQVRVLSPSGTAIASWGFLPTATNLKQVVTLPASGTYTIWVDPLGLNHGSLAISVKGHVE